MERLTYDFCINGMHCWQVKGADNLECGEVCESRNESGCIGCPIANAFDRLAAIEDILGDEYDPERLRELVQADQMIGKTVYYTIAGKILEKRVSSFVIYDERRAGLRPKENWFCVNNDDSETFDFSDIGKTIFLTRKEAEAALRRAQE